MSAGRTRTGGPRRALRASLASCSPDDARAAVLAARGAAAEWTACTATGRGMVLYRLAEIMEARREELCAAAGQGRASPARTAAEVDAAIDRTIYYAGFCDKLQPLLASRDPVSGPHVAMTSVEPMGIVALLVARGAGLLGVVSVVLPAVAAGNVCVVVVAARDARPALAWRECLATCGLPAAAIQVLAGRPAELVPILANHPDVAAAHDASDVGARAARADPGQGLARIARFVRYTTFWHPVGM